MEKSDDIMTDIHQYLQELDHPLKEATYGETFDMRPNQRLLRLLDIICFPYFERITTR
jgi:nitrate reductase assembly molybdenum cofactor insertion protein NarJ